MRGKRPPHGGGLHPLGITPADAGKTIFLYSFLSKNRDHPRGCGENVLAQIRDAALPGSPPRMRGKQQPLLKKVAGFRITPADAGKTHNYFIGC